MDSFDRRTPGDAAQNGASNGPASGETGSGQRTKVRDSLLLVAQCRLGDQRSDREVRVRNLSEGGLMIELDTPADVGTRVWLNLRGIGEIVGKVAWCAAGRMGIALDSPIDPKKARKPVGGSAKPGLLGL